MKKMMLACLVFISTMISASAQNPNDIGLDMDDYFVYLRDSTLLEENQFTIQEKLLTVKYFDQDGKLINLNDIKYMHTERGLYGGVLGSTLVGQTYSRFAKLYEKGQISIYRYVESNGSRNSSVTYYYSEGLGDLKKPTYANLKNDLVIKGTDNVSAINNRQITELLEKGNNSRKSRNKLLIGGIATFLVGSVIYSQGEGGRVLGTTKAPNRNLMITGLGVSVVGIGVTAASLFRKSENPYFKAIRIYNQNY